MDAEVIGNVHHPALEPDFLLLWYYGDTSRNEEGPDEEEASESSRGVVVCGFRWREIRRAWQVCGVLCVGIEADMIGHTGADFVYHLSQYRPRVGQGGQ